MSITGSGARSRPMVQMGRVRLEMFITGSGEEEQW